MNQVVLVGRLSDEPSVAKTENGKNYTTVHLAVQRPFKNSDGIYETDFIRVVLWNGIASNTSEYCHTGDIVGIKGRLQSRSYETEDNEKKYITEVIAERVSFISANRSKKEDSKDK